jgi:DNA invertase Pin-like site-specific DNA recombinase
MAIEGRAEGGAMALWGYSYMRFSGRRQEAGDSQRRQDDLALAAAREEGVQLDATLRLRDPGLSAYRGANWKKGDLGKFLDLVKGGIIPAGSVLIIERLDRLSRMPWMDAVEMLREILSLGIVIRTCCPPSRLTRANINSLGVGCPVVIALMLANQESEQKSERVRDAWAQKKKLAAERRVPHGRDCPAWIRPVTRRHDLDPGRVVTTGYELIPERAAVMRRIFEMARDDRRGARRILRWLADNVEPWGRSGRWTLSYVKKLLAGREAVGEYQPYYRPVGGLTPSQARKEAAQSGKDVKATVIPAGPAIPGYYPAALEEGLFLAARAARRGRKKKGGQAGHSEANLFTHLIYSTDGLPMHFKRRSVAGKRYHYLTSRGEAESIPYEAFEWGVLNTLASLQECDVDGRHEATALTARVAQLQQDRGELALQLESLRSQLKELPAARWPAMIVAHVAELEESAEVKRVEWETAKRQADTSGRVDVLASMKLCVALLRKVKGTPDEVVIRRRIKARLPMLLEAVWVRVQSGPLSRGRYSGKYVHVRLYLCGGEQRYFWFDHGHTDGMARLPLDGVDFREEAGR